MIQEYPEWSLLLRLFPKIQTQSPWPVHPLIGSADTIKHLPPRTRLAVWDSWKPRQKLVESQPVSPSSLPFLSLPLSPSLAPSSPNGFYVDVLPQNVTLLGTELLTTSLAEVRLVGQIVIQYSCCPYRKKKLQQTLIWRECQVKMKAAIRALPPSGKERQRSSVADRHVLGRVSGGG